MKEIEYEVTKPVTKKELEERLLTVSELLNEERARNLRLVDRIRKLEARIHMYATQ